MFPPGRQRMVEQARLLPDPRIDIVLLKIAPFGRSVKAGSIETSSCPQTDFLFRVELDEGPAAPAPTVMEDGFLIIIVQAALRFQADLHLVANRKCRRSVKPLGSPVQIFESARHRDEVFMIVPH